MNDTERKQIVSDFFSKADAENLLVYKKFSKFPESLQHSMRNRVEENKTFKEVIGIFKDHKKLKTLVDFNEKQLKINSVHTRRILAHYIIFHAFNIIEMHKGFLVQLVNSNKEIGSRDIKVTEKTTLN